MIRVKCGSVPQNWRASSRAAAVQRLCPMSTRTLSPGRTFSDTASAREVTTGRVVAGANAVMK